VAASHFKGAGAHFKELAEIEYTILGDY